VPEDQPDELGWQSLLKEPHSSLLDELSVLLGINDNKMKASL
jgi:hypothetical protein